MKLALKAIAGLFDILPGWVWAALLAAAFSRGCLIDGQLTQERLKSAQAAAALATIESQRQEAARLATDQFRNKERREMQAAMEIEREAQLKSKSLVSSAATSRSSAERLLGDIAALDAAARSRGLPSASACPAELEAERARAQTARQLFGSCVKEYRDLAEDADGIALRLETAINYLAIPAADRPAP